MKASLLTRASLRFYRQHPAQLLLMLLGIALGTAVMIAVALANRAALQSFDRSIDALAGPMSHEIRALEGPLEESLYRALRLDFGVRDALPLLELSVVIDDESLQLIGLDPLALPGEGAGSGLRGAPLLQLLTAPGAVIAPEGIADRRGWRPRESVAVTIAGHERQLSVLAVRAGSDGEWFGDVLLADIAVAQDLSGRRGELDRILLRLEDPLRLESLRQWLPDNLELRAFNAQRETFAAMTRAFRINLSAMSLLALLVGAFLVYNAMSFAVVQRQGVFATLRLLGVTPQQLRRRLFLEAGLFGLLGALLGLLLGLFLGQALLLLVTRTVSDLYLEIQPLRPDLSWQHMLLALAASQAAVMLAAAGPARAAGRVAPVGLLGAAPDRAPLKSPVALLLPAMALLLACPLLVAVSGRSLLLGFVALFMLLLGYSLLLPTLLRLLLRALRAWRPLSARPLRALTLRGVERSLPRLGPAVMALSIAVSATVGVAIMIDSFRASVAQWLDNTLQGDLYLYAAGDGERLAPQWRDRVAALPGVSAVSVGRLRRLVLDGERTPVLVLESASGSGRGFELLDAEPGALDAVLTLGDGVLISEPLARRRKLAPGDLLQMSTPDGTTSLAVRGVYRDYGNSRGAVILAYRFYAEHFDEPEISTLALEISPSVDSEALLAQILALGNSHGIGLSGRSAVAIRERSLEIFDRTFVITEVLRVLVVIVAFVGIVSALLALFLERRREFAVLRATGMTPLQLLGLLLGQAGLSGLLAGLLALPLGVLMSVMLIDVINLRSFGWTMQLRFDSLLLLQALALAVAAALLAALWPARRLAVAALRPALQDP